MFRPLQLLPVSNGPIVNALRDGLTADWGTGLSGGTKLPEVKTRRMFTVRDDSGPLVRRVQARRQGVNVWADDPEDAQNMARNAVMICQSTLPNGVVVVATRDFSGPIEIEDEIPYIVGGKDLTHYYFAFTAAVKASKPA